MGDIFLTLIYVLGGIFGVVVIGAIVCWIVGWICAKASENKDEKSNKAARFVVGLVIVAIGILFFRACISNYHPTPGDVYRSEHPPF